MEIPSFFFFLLLSMAILLNPISCKHRPVKVNRHVAMFVFGDSSFDTGNNNYINTTAFFQGDYLPYGETYFGYATGRTSDGRIIPDFIGQWAGLPLLAPYLQPGNEDYYYGSNLASVGGACLAETATGLVIHLKTQVEYFKDVVKKLRTKLGVKRANELLGNAVYLFGIASNDYVSPILTNSTWFRQFTHQQYVDIVVGNLTDGIKEVYANGGRKFGFLGLQDLGCVPVLRVRREDGSCHEEVTALSKLHNAAFAKRAKELEQELKGFKYANFDFFNASNERLHNPTKYGLEYGETACCGVGRFRGTNTCGGKKQGQKYELCKDPSKYLFFDSGRFTDAASQQFAQIWWSGTTSDNVQPYNLKSLFQHF